MGYRSQLWLSWTPPRATDSYGTKVPAGHHCTGATSHSEWMAGWSKNTLFYPSFTSPRPDRIVPRTQWRMSIPLRNVDVRYWIVLRVFKALWTAHGRTGHSNIIYNVIWCQTTLSCHLTVYFTFFLPNFLNYAHLCNRSRLRLCKLRPAPLFSNCS